MTNRLLNGQFQLYISHPSCALATGLVWTDIPSIIHFQSPSRTREDSEWMRSYPTALDIFKSQMWKSQISTCQFPPLLLTLTSSRQQIPGIIAYTKRNTENFVF